MKKEDVEKLLGGYATGTLTGEERQALFEAALTDQVIFDALGSEQALKELLDDPHARRRLLMALQDRERRQGLFGRLLESMMRPAVVTLAGGMAVAALAVVSVTKLLETVPPPQPSTPSEQVIAGKKKEAAAAKPGAKDQLDATTKGTKEEDAKRNVAAVAPASSEPGSVRDLFYSIRAAGGQQTFADRPSREAAAEQKPAGKPAAAAPMTEGSGRASVEVQSMAKLEAPGQPTLQRLGLRYTVLQPEPGSVTLAVEVNQAGYLYVLTRDATGASRLLFPTRIDAPQDARVEQDTRYLIPPTGPLRLEAEQIPGLIVVLARAPRSDVQGLLSRSRSSSNVLREEVIETRAGAANVKTVYVVETTPSPILSVDIPQPPRQ